MMHQKQPILHNKSSHLLKVRRVSTYNHPSRTQSSLQQSFNQDQPSFNIKPKIQSEVLHKKENFVSSLINKLKNVERYQVLSNPCRQAILKIAESQGSLNKAQKGKKQNEDKNKRQNIQKQTISCQNRNKSIMLEPQKTQPYRAKSYGQLELQNSILRQKVHELIIQNEKIKLKANKANTQLQEKEASLSKRQKQLNNLLIELQQKQKKLLNNQSLKSQQLPKKTHSQALFHSFSKQIQSQTNLSIYKQVNEIIMPINNDLLSKASQQIKQLRLQKLQLQKKFTKTLSQYRKKKEQQIQRMKKTFTSNLAHYKDLLLKVSFKLPAQVKKYQEDTFQTVILETSSADQS